MKQTKLSTFIRSYWDYYIELENEFSATQKYVAFDKHNARTFSIEYLKLLQAVCSEIDVVAKEISVALDPTFKIERNTNIQKWGYVLQNKLPQILSAQVVFNHNTLLSPWDDWKYEKTVNKAGKNGYRLSKGKKSLKWWTAYTDVKHARTEECAKGIMNFSKANLENLTLSFAALFILESEYIKTFSAEQEPIGEWETSKLFQPYFPQFPDVIY
jgi:hypothetical protein